MDKTRILVIDFGSQYSHLICRRSRELNVYSELCACTTSLLDVQKFNPTGIIVSGGPSSVYDPGAPHLGSDVWDFIRSQNLPVLGICYGLQEMMYANGGVVEKGPKREFGLSTLVVDSQNRRGGLFGDIPKEKFTVWMSHGDKVTQLADGFRVTAVSDNSEMCAVESANGRWFGLQFHPEVTHSEFGGEIFRNFIVNICKCETSWTMKNFIQFEVDKIVELVGDRHVIGAVSGGVDSSVGAALVYKALGNRFHPILVDTGLMRLNEAAEVKHRLENHIPGLNLLVVDAKKKFLTGLSGVSDPEKKRKIIGGLFIETFDDTVKNIMDLKFM